MHVSWACQNKKELNHVHPFTQRSGNYFQAGKDADKDPLDTDKIFTCWVAACLGSCPGTAMYVFIEGNCFLTPAN